MVNERAVDIVIVNTDCFYPAESSLVYVSLFSHTWNHHSFEYLKHQAYGQHSGSGFKWKWLVGFCIKNIFYYIILFNDTLLYTVTLSSETSLTGKKI